MRVGVSVCARARVGMCARLRVRVCVCVRARACVYVCLTYQYPRNVPTEFVFINSTLTDFEVFGIATGLTKDPDPLSDSVVRLNQLL